MVNLTSSCFVYTSVVFDSLALRLYKDFTNMKTIVYLLGVITLVRSYADVSDKIHFEDIIKKPDELKAQLYCYLDKGPCDEISATHKHHMSEAVNDGCAKCTPTHKHNVRVFIQAVSHLFPDLYDQLRHRYDPDGQHYGVLIEKVQKY